MISLFSVGHVPIPSLKNVARLISFALAISPVDSPNFVIKKIDNLGLSPRYFRDATDLECGTNEVLATQEDTVDTVFEECVTLNRFNQLGCIPDNKQAQILSDGFVKQFYNEGGKNPIFVRDAHLDNFCLKEDIQKNQCPDFNAARFIKIDCDISLQSHEFLFLNFFTDTSKVDFGQCSSALTMLSEFMMIYMMMELFHAEKLTVCDASYYSENCNILNIEDNYLQPLLSHVSEGSTSFGFITQFKEKVINSLSEKKRELLELNKEKVYKNFDYFFYEMEENFLIPCMRILSFKN